MSHAWLILLWELADRPAAAGPGRGPGSGGRDLHPAGRDRRPRAQGFGHHPLLANQ
jgi:hypothetical protein